MAALAPRVCKCKAFRKLKDHEARTSYSRGGGYYRFDELGDCDEHGLWAFAGVCFSRVGRLVASAEALVNDAEAGHFVDEVDKGLGVGSQALRRPVLRQLAEWPVLRGSAPASRGLIGAGANHDPAPADPFGPAPPR